MEQVFIGVDPHKLSATIEIVDQHENLLGSSRFTTDRAGYTAMRTYAKTWPDRVWAVEGANGVGRPLAQRLLEAGEHVVDVPAKLAARIRMFDTGHNRKTDERDAHSIAVVAVRTPTLRVLHVDGELEAQEGARRAEGDGPGTWLEADGSARRRAGRRSEDPGRRRRRGPVRRPEPVRVLDRHRTAGRLLRGADPAPAVAGGQPEDEPHAAPRRSHPGPARHRRPALLPAQARRGQDPDGGHAVPEETDL